MSWLLALMLAVLAGQPYVALATTATCEASSTILEGKVLEGIAASTVAFQGEVTALESNVQMDSLFPDGKLIAGTQKITFRVVNSWKGPYPVGTAVRLTVSVTSFCAGVGCVSPYKIGDVTLVLSPFPQSELPELSVGSRCWTTYAGVEVKRVLWVPSLSDD
jgi:hypothetical protein